MKTEQEVKSALVHHFDDLIENENKMIKAALAYGVAIDQFQAQTGIKKLIPKAYYKTANVLNSPLREWMEDMHKHLRKQLSIPRKEKINNAPKGFNTQPYKVIKEPIKIIKR